MFKTMGTVFKNQYPQKEDIKKISSFVFIRWLSNNKLTVIPANIINYNYNIPIENQYKFLKDYYKLTGINKKVSFIKYNKNEKENEIIQNIAKFYSVNYYTAKSYYNLMDKKEHKRFKDMYKEGRIN